MTSDDLDMPSLKAYLSVSARGRIDFYLAENIPLVGKARNGFDDAPDDLDGDGDPSKPISQRSIDMKSKRYYAEKFIGAFVASLTEQNADPELINEYLERIANNETYPCYVVDAALRFQDLLIEETPQLKAERESLQHDYMDVIKHLESAKPS